MAIKMLKDYYRWINPLKLKMLQNKRERKLITCSFISGIIFTNIVLIFIMNGGF